MKTIVEIDPFMNGTDRTDISYIDPELVAAIADRLNGSEVVIYWQENLGSDEDPVEYTLDGFIEKVRASSELGAVRHFRNMFT